MFDNFCVVYAVVVFVVIVVVVVVVRDLRKNRVIKFVM